jgi:hypothetical protein
MNGDAFSDRPLDSRRRQLVTSRERVIDMMADALWQVDELRDALKLSETPPDIRLLAAELDELYAHLNSMMARVTD